MRNPLVLSNTLDKSTFTIQMSGVVEFYRFCFILRKNTHLIYANNADPDVIPRGCLCSFCGMPGIDGLNSCGVN